jgi:hypothetical protein
MPSHSDGHGRGRGIVNILLSPCRRLRAGMQFHAAGRDMRAEVAMSGLILMAAVIVLLLATRSGTEKLQALTDAAATAIVVETTPPEMFTDGGSALTPVRVSPHEVISTHPTRVSRVVGETRS